MDLNEKMPLFILFRLYFPQDQLADSYVGRLKISENVLNFLIDLGDTEMGFETRGEVAEMYGIAIEELDALVLGVTYGDNPD